MISDDLYAKLNALREQHRGKMNSASDRAERMAAIGEMGEVSISSTESERHREAFQAMNQAIAIVEASATQDHAHG